MVQYSLEMQFSQVSDIYLFSPWNLLRNNENQQRSSNLRLVNEI